MQLRDVGLRLVGGGVGAHLEAGDDRGESGQERRVGGAAGEVERGVEGAVESLVAPRHPLPREGAHETAGAAPALDESGGAERLPRVADRRGRYPEVAREVANRRESVAGSEVAGRDEARDGARDAVGGALLHGEGYRTQGSALQTRNGAVTERNIREMFSAKNNKTIFREAA